MDELKLPIECAKGVGKRRSATLREAGIYTLGDLLYYLPRRYLDRSRVVPIGRAPLKQEVTLVGQIRQIRFVPGSRPRLMLVVEDETGEMVCIWFQGGRYLQRNFAEGDLLALSGKVELFQGQRQMVHPEYEFIRPAGEQELLHTGGIIPLYATSAELKDRGLRSRGFRRLIHAALREFGPGIRDELPEELRLRLGLMGKGESLWQVHFPETLEKAQQARRRLAFEELFDLQLRLARRRRRRCERTDGIPFSRSQHLVPALLASLPFSLTHAQSRAIEEIAADMERPIPMYRLLQGEVGSGKTLVALVAMLTAVENGYQAALMAPTELLAEQHFFNLQRLVDPLGVRLVLLRGSQGTEVRRELLAAIASGQAQIAVGTHALIQEGVEFARLGLAVVDEQHRFGVRQRAKLYRKGRQEDLLVMTATPIPRTLALTLYGDLEVSVLDELPPGRQPVRTALRFADRREAVFAFAAEQLRQGQQIYVVYPLVEESEKLDLKSAIEGWEELRRGPFREFAVGLVHGRMEASERAAAMAAFREGRLQVLVSTTVVEVGVDLPRATVMIVEHAERFGLAQLHQLRGRVGRGSAQSYCILIAYSPKGDNAWQRLEILCRTQNGFEIAEKDLELRGPGEFFGVRQAGMPAFKVADLARDQELLDLARQEAVRLVGGRL